MKPEARAWLDRLVVGVAVVAAAIVGAIAVSVAIDFATKIF